MPTTHIRSRERRVADALQDEGQFFIYRPRLLKVARDSELLERGSGAASSFNNLVEFGLLPRGDRQAAGGYPRWAYHALIRVGRRDRRSTSLRRTPLPPSFKDLYFLNDLRLLLGSLGRTPSICSAARSIVVASLRSAARNGLSPELGLRLRQKTVNIPPAPASLLGRGGAIFQEAEQYRQPFGRLRTDIMALEVAEMKHRGVYDVPAELLGKSKPSGQRW